MLEVGFSRSAVPVLPLRAGDADKRTSSMNRTSGNPDPNPTTCRSANIRESTSSRNSSGSSRNRPEMPGHVRKHPETTGNSVVDCPISCHGNNSSPRWHCSSHGVGNGQQSSSAIAESSQQMSTL